MGLKILTIVELIVLIKQFSLLEFDPLDLELDFLFNGIILKLSRLGMS